MSNNNNVEKTPNAETHDYKKGENSFLDDLFSRIFGCDDAGDEQLEYDALYDKYKELKDVKDYTLQFINALEMAFDPDNQCDHMSPEDYAPEDLIKAFSHALGVIDFALLGMNSVIKDEDVSNNFHNALVTMHHIFNATVHILDNIEEIDIDDE